MCIESSFILFMYFIPSAVCTVIRLQVGGPRVRILVEASVFSRLQTIHCRFVANSESYSIKTANASFWV
jgi:hypothetical protein